MNTNASPFFPPPNPSYSGYNTSYFHHYWTFSPPRRRGEEGEEERGLFTTPPPPLSHARAKNKESRGGDDAQICGKLARESPCVLKLSIQKVCFLKFLQVLHCPFPLFSVRPFSLCLSLSWVRSICLARQFSVSYFPGEEEGKKKWFLYSGGVGRRRIAGSLYGRRRRRRREVEK